MLILQISGNAMWVRLSISVDCTGPVGCSLPIAALVPLWLFSVILTDVHLQSLFCANVFCMFPSHLLSSGFLTDHDLLANNTVHQTYIFRNFFFN